MVQASYTPRENPFVNRSEGREHVTIKTVGVIGAGQMGNGIAHVAAIAGYNVLLHDLSKERVEAALATINGNMTRQIARGKITEDDRDKALNRITYAASLEAFSDAELVIEAATEDEDIKRKILTGVCPHLKPASLIGSNTSSISITRLAAVTDRPEQFIGMHFMNPVPVMDLVEMIRGIATDESTFAVSRKFVESLGKTVTVAEDFPAFIVNGTTSTCGFHRPRHMSFCHASVVRRTRRYQVSAVPATRKIRGSRVAWP
jgi:3-hydroxybutyryl-CoA dehydrogenase